MNNFYEEAVAFTYGNNFKPNPQRFRIPTDSNTTIFLLTDSFEYDVQMIKNFPSPKMNFKNILIPNNINVFLGNKALRYSLTSTDLTKYEEYLNKQHLTPELTVLAPPYQKNTGMNVYVSMSGLMKKVNEVIKSYPEALLYKYIYTLFEQSFKSVTLTKNKVLWIDTTRFKLSNDLSKTTKQNLIDALLSAYKNSSMVHSLKDWVIIFKGTESDFRFDLSLYEKRDEERLQDMVNAIGHSSSVKKEEPVEEVEEEITEEDEKVVEDIKNDNNEPEEEYNSVSDIETDLSDTSRSIRTTINSLIDKYRKPGESIDEETQRLREENRKNNSLYNAKSLQVRTSMMTRINPDETTVNNYTSLSDLLKKGENDTVENDIYDNVSKQILQTSKIVNSEDVMNTVTSPREQQIRTQVGQVKLNNVDFDTITSITDTPLPEKVRPHNVGSVNKAIQEGTQFTNISREYEKKLMDRDIVAVLTNISELPNGFYVTNVDVTDVSTPVTMMNNWKVSLKNKQTDKSCVINIRLPKMVNGRFLDNGIWYTINKQDFPIPILKIDKKRVIMTSNYHKISVERHDTKSLVDVGLFVKTIKNLSGDDPNKYVSVGSSVATNSRFVSTIEYDEYAKIWRSFVTPECRILFNRQECLKEYSFVTVQENEFCCGMINNVPVVINTDTGLTRSGETLTSTMLSLFDEKVRQSYSKLKPGKVLMYTEIMIGIKIPLGVAVAAWEGLTNLLKRANTKYQVVDKTFNDPHYFIIPFKDKSLAILNTIQNQLLFNGFYRINTKAHDIGLFEDPIMNNNSIYVDIFNQNFFKQYSQITIFIANYNFFVDPITKDVCLHYNLPSDICGMLVYASNILADNNFMSETNSALYRIRSSEIIPAILHYKLAVALARYNNRTGSKMKGNNLQFNPNEVMNELRSSPAVTTISALNPMIELYQSNTISKKGFSGVNDDRAYTQDRRAFDESMIGKMAISSPNNAGVGVTRQLVVDPKIESVRGYTSTKGSDEKYSDLQLASFAELITSGTISRDDAIRSAIATSQTGHIVPTLEAEPTIISNGIDELVPSCLSEEFSVMAEDDGTVLETNEDYMIIQYKNGNKRAININDRYSFNPGSGYFVNNKLTANFNTGDSFVKNDVLAYHEKFFTKGVDNVIRMNIGPMAKVAFMGLYSTYEDAGLITSKMSKRLATRTTLRQQIKIDVSDDIDSIVKIGDEVDILDPLIVFGMGDTGDKAVDNFLKAFGGESSDLLASAKRVIKSKNAGHIVDITMYTTKPIEKLSPSLQNLFREYYKRNIQKRKILDKYDKHDSSYKLGTLYTLPTGPLPGNTIKGITCDVLIEIHVEHEYDSGVGDKLVVYGASKQVTSETIPEGLEPYAEGSPEEEISLFIAPSSILKRMIPSLLTTASGNKVMIHTKKLMGKIWRDEM